MFSITFQPGPSQLSPQMKSDICEAMDLRMGEISHRSDEFSKMSAETQKNIRTFFGIPDDYAVLFVTSATEAMEILIRNLVTETSFHFTNGVFSELFYDIAKRYGKNALRDDVAWGKQNDIAAADIPVDSELITLSFCETTTGVMCQDEDIATLRKKHPNHLIAVDITSMAGMKAIRVADADIWFFSVQKGMGLPSGMGVMIVSPRAIERAEKLRLQGKTHPGLFALPDMKAICDASSQTLNTPNVLSIHLLGKQLARWNREGGIAPLEAATRRKAALLYELIDARKELTCFAENPRMRSISVICISAPPPLVASIKKDALAQDILLGSGYGPLKEKTFRLANFPAITQEDMEKAKRILLESLNGA